MKNKILRSKWYILTFVVAFALMLLYQFVWTSADRLPGNDSYTHIAKAALLKDYGIDRASYATVLPFTYWNTINADNTLAYDYFLIGLTAVATSIMALKIYIALVFAASTTLFAKIINYKRKQILLGCAFALIASVGNIAFLLKYTELRSLVYSIIAFFITLGILFIYRKRYWVLVPVAFVMTLVHTTVFLLFVPIFILSVFDIKNWKLYLRTFIYVMIGIILAILVFPSGNFYQILVIQPIIPFIYKTIPFPIDGAFEVKGDLTNPGYLLVSNIINIIAVITAVVLYVLAYTRRMTLKYNKYKVASLVIFILFFVLDLFSRRFSDYLTPAMIIFVVLHQEDIVKVLTSFKPFVLKYKFAMLIFLVVAMLGFGYVFYDKYLKDNISNTDYRGNEKSNLPETYAASLYLNKHLADGSYIYDDAWEDFPYLLYYSPNYKYGAGMELGFLYMYKSEMLRFYQDFRNDNGFVERNGDLVYDRDNITIRDFIATNFKSNTILVKKGKTEKMSQYLLDNYQKIKLSKVFDDDFYTIYQF